MHAAVVEGRTLVFVSFAGCESRGHVADADDRQLADLALRDEVADGLVIPGIAQIEVHRREQGRFFGQLHGLPLLFGAFGDRFFRNDVFPGGDGLFDLFLAGVGQGEKPHDLDLGIVENHLFVGDDFRSGSQFMRQLPGFGRKVADIYDIPFSAFLHFVEVETSHSSETDQADLNRIHFVGLRFI